MSSLVIFLLSTHKTHPVHGLHPQIWRSICHFEPLLVVTGLLTTVEEQHRLCTTVQLSLRILIRCSVEL